MSQQAAKVPKSYSSFSTQRDKPWTTWRRMARDFHALLHISQPKTRTDGKREFLIAANDVAIRWDARLGNHTCHREESGGTSMMSQQSGLAYQFDWIQWQATPQSGDERYSAYGPVTAKVTTGNGWRSEVSFCGKDAAATGRPKIKANAWNKKSFCCLST